MSCKIQLAYRARVGKNPLANGRCNEYLARLKRARPNRNSPPRPVTSPEQEAHIGLLRTADWLTRGVECVVKPSGLSPTQYNVLRILRGAGVPGLACRQIADRMLTRDPDITRLLDRLEARRLVQRARPGRDRRVILTRITPEGLRLLKPLDRPIAELHQAQLGHLGRAQLRRLVRLLEQARAGAK